MSAIQLIPCEILCRINQHVGFKPVTKFGQRGVINLIKIVPIADYAYKTFIEQDFAYTTNHATDDYYDVEYTEV